jgi:hypothetical protein
MPFRQYTHCVQPSAYQDPVPGGDPFQILATIVFAPFTGGFQLATAVCGYLLGGKLVCLGGDRCAIGHLTKFETPSDKSFPSNIDNDFSMNLLLAPFDLNDFVNGDRIQNYNTARSDPVQGVLITELTSDGKPPAPDGSNVLMPMPHSPADDPRPSPEYHGYTTDYPDSNYLSYDPNNAPFQVPGSDGGHPFQVPVLHLECEGSRIHDVCVALSTFWNPVQNSGLCDIPIIGPVLCFAASLALLPLVAAAAAAAWAGATDGNADDSRIDTNGGSLKLGDLIIVTGGWVYDAGHEGWNELHPAKTIQKIDDHSYDGANFPDFYKRACTLTMQVPPFEFPPNQPAGMTPTQQVIYDNQRRPENRWYFHPLIDSCEPARPPETR